MYAALNGNIDVVKLLLRYGGQKTLHAVSKTGGNALSNAEQAGHAVIVDLLKHAAGNQVCSDSLSEAMTPLAVCHHSRRSQRARTQRTAGRCVTARVYHPIQVSFTCCFYVCTVSATLQLSLYGVILWF